MLYGPEDFSRFEFIKKKKEQLGEEALAKANILTLEGKKLSLEDIEKACVMTPFFSSQRMVVIEGLLERFEKAQKLGEWEKLGELVARLPPSTILIFNEEKIERENPLLKLLEEAGAQVKHFPRLKEEELRKWVARRARECGGEISPEAVEALLELAGENLWILASEIEKLCLYCGERVIRGEDVRALVGISREGSVFLLGDAVAEGDLELSLRELRRLLSEGAPPPLILFMLTREFRLLLQALEGAEGLSQAEMAAKMGLSPYALRKVREKAKRFSPSSLREIYDKLLRADLQIKSGRMRGEEALYLLVLDLCRSKEGR